MSIEGSGKIISSPRGGVTFAFIDADNVRNQFESALIRRKIRREELCAFDMNKLFWLANADRYYVFSATPDLSEPEDWLRKLRASDKCIFRSGRLTISKSGRKQQGVDVMIALEAARSAFYGHLDNCILFSGDGDMLPLVDTIVNTGKAMIVVAFGDPDKGDVASRLRDAADSYIHVGSTIFAECMEAEHRFYGAFQENTVDLRANFREYVRLEGLHQGAVLVMKNGRVNLIKESSIVVNQAQHRVAQFGSLIGASAYLKLRGSVHL